MRGHGECVGIQNKLDSVALVGRVALLVDNAFCNGARGAWKRIWRKRDVTVIKTLLVTEGQKE